MMVNRKLKGLALFALSLMLGLMVLGGLVSTTLPAPTVKADNPTLDYDFNLGTVSTLDLGHSDARLGLAWDGTYYYRCHVEGGDTGSLCRRATTIAGLAASGVEEWIAQGLPRWPVGLWYNPANNTFYMTSHNEFYYTYNFHYRSITLYKSTDGLHTVQQLGDIVTSDNYTTPLGVDYNGRYVQDGPGDHSLFVDVPHGYAYIFYDDPTFNDFLLDDYAHSLPSLPVVKPARVARVAISDLDDVTKWHKFYQGNWNQPALGGHASDLNANGGEVYVFYSTVLNRYIMFNQNNYVQSATSLDSQNWTPEYQLKTPDVTGNFQYVSEYTLLDQDTHDQYRIGGGNVLAIQSNPGPSVEVRPFSTISYSSNPYYTNVRPAITPGEYANFFQQPYDPEFNGTPVENPESVLMKWNDNPVTYNNITTYANYTGTYNAAMMRASGIGAYAQTSINVAKPGLYKVYSYNRTFTAAGKWQLSVNGVDQGPVINLYDQAPKYGTYGDTTVYYRRFDMGYINITSTGPQTIKYTLVGTDPHATNGGLDGQVDAVRFELVTDNFNDASLNNQWSWVREDSSKWSLSSGSLHLVTNGGDLAGGTNNASNLLLRKVYKAKFPYGNWEITTQVNFNPGVSGQGAGLIAYADDDNYVRLSLKNIGGTKSVEAAVETSGSLTANNQPYSNSTVYLRISKTNDRYRWYYSSDNINWSLLRDQQLDLGTKWPRVGLASYGSSSAATADFDWFDLRSGNYYDQGLNSAAYNRPVQTDSEQGANLAKYAVDGDGLTKWVANDGNTSHYIQIDLGGSYGENFNLNGSEFYPGTTDFAYKYKIEVSTDGSVGSWVTKVDRTNNTESGSVLSDIFTASDIRYVRLTVTGDTTHPPSVNEFKVFAGSSHANFQYDLPPLPTGGGSPTPTPTASAPTPTPTAGAGPTPTPTPTVGGGGTTYLSDLSWTSATTGYGAVQKDKSVNGNAIKLNGNTYAKGIGAHAASTIIYNIGGAGYSSFLGDVGLDDETGAGGSVVFQVYLDGNKAYDSGLLHGGDPHGSFNLSVSGKSELKLVITDGGDNINSDHGDWAGARLSGSATATPTPTPAPPTPTPTATPGGGGTTSTYLSDLSWTSATTGYGSIQKDKSVNGNAIKLNGNTYAKGIGAHAISTIIYNIGGAGYTSFVGDVGVDDESVGAGSVVFQIYLDNNKVYDSGLLHGGDPHGSFNVSVSGKSELKLVITDGGNGINSDHGDWAGARLLQ